MDPQVGAIGKVVSFLEYILAVGLVGAHFLISFGVVFEFLEIS